MRKLLLILTILAFTSITIFAQMESRIIRVDKVDVDEDNEIYLEITSFKVGESNIFFNESFTADENWLKNIKVKVKNISGKNITCLGLSLGLLEGIDEKLEPQMSWGWVLGLYKGNCSAKKDKSKNKFLIKNNEVIELTYADINPSTAKYFNEMNLGKFHQAKFAYGATIIFENEKKEADQSYFSAPNNVRYFEEDSEEN